MIERRAAQHRAHSATSLRAISNGFWRYNRAQLQPDDAIHFAGARRHEDDRHVAFLVQRAARSILAGAGQAAWISEQDEIDWLLNRAPATFPARRRRADDSCFPAMRGDMRNAGSSPDEQDNRKVIAWALIANGPRGRTTIEQGGKPEIRC